MIKINIRRAYDIHMIKSICTDIYYLENGSDNFGVDGTVWINTAMYYQKVIVSGYE